MSREFYHRDLATWVRTREFAFYRLAGGLIREVWVAADNLELKRQLA